MHGLRLIATPAQHFPGRSQFDDHMQLEETLQAHLDLKGQWLLSVHNGTFDLALHPWYEPFERITALGAEKDVPVTTPRMGEMLNLRQPHAGTHWWTAVK